MASPRNNNFTDHARLIKTDIAANSNKFWNAWLYPNGDVEVEHGRVGESVRPLFYPGRGSKYYQEKVREKDRKGYKPVQTLDGNVTSTKAPTVHRSELKEVAKRDIGNGNKIVEALIESLVEENIHMIEGVTTITYNRATGTFSTPLGLITPHAISQARRLLDEIDEIREKNNFSTYDANQTIEKYLMLIPQRVGRKLDPVELFGSIAAIRKQNDVLDALESASKPVATPQEDAKTDAPTTDKIFKVTLEVASLEDFRHVRHLFHSTKVNQHNCRLGIETAYRLHIQHMDEAFESTGKKVGNIKEMWHGTKNANVLSILKRGFQTSPPRSVAITYKMFGQGTYFSLSSSKSTGYIDGGRWNSLGKKPKSFLFLNNVAMGKPHYPRNSCISLTTPPKGCHSVEVLPGQAGVLNHECVIFQMAQIQPTFLLELVEGGK